MPGPDTERTIADLPKSGGEVVRVRRTTFRGYELVDLRVFTPGDRTGDFAPTHKGITVRVELLPRLLGALHQAERDAREAGLLNTDDDGDDDA